jgi:DNA repair protein RadC
MEDSSKLKTNSLDKCKKNMMAVKTTTTPPTGGKKIRIPSDLSELSRGHRERVRKKFSEMPFALEDYELLELLLFPMIPRKDTRVLAKVLLKHFGSLETTICADPGELRDVEGIGERVADSIEVVRVVMRRIMSREMEITGSIMLTKPNLLKKYLTNCLGFLNQEKLLVLFLSKSGRLLKEMLMSVGNNSSVSVPIVRIIGEATRLNAGGILLAHNHPSGDATPSGYDVGITETIRNIAARLKIGFVDHIVVAGNKAYRVSHIIGNGIPKKTSDD